MRCKENCKINTQLTSILFQISWSAFRMSLTTFNSSGLTHSNLLTKSIMWMSKLARTSFLIRNQITWDNGKHLPCLSRVMIKCN